MGSGCFYAGISWGPLGCDLWREEKEDGVWGVRVLEGGAIGSIDKRYGFSYCKLFFFCSLFVDGWWVNRNLFWTLLPKAGTVCCTVYNQKNSASFQFTD